MGKKVQHPGRVHAPKSSGHGFEFCLNLIRPSSGSNITDEPIEKLNRVDSSVQLRHTKKIVGVRMGDNNKVGCFGCKRYPQGIHL